MPVCAICEQNVERWLPDPQREAYSPILRVLDVIGADADHHFCPSCGADDRERHTWLYLSATGILNEAAGRAALHVGPEPRLREKLSRLSIDWTFAEDACPERLQRECRNSQFHLIICNRILPGVPSVDATIRALMRCLASGGWLVAQSAYSPMLTRTLEFLVPLTKKAAHLFLGDEQHQRLFGADAAGPFVAAGLQGGLYAHEAVLPAVDASTWGCNPREPLFLFSRQRCLTSQS